MDGTIIKGIAGFYYVKSGEITIECKSRGKFRYSGFSPMVGDKVCISMDGDKGVIEQIYPRRSVMSRPSVANVTQAFVVFAVKNPEINEELLNKVVVNCEACNLKIIICLNKVDLDPGCERGHLVEMMRNAGYEVVFLQAKEGIGIDEIKRLMKNQTSVLCGPSGVGKSTIMNKIAGRELMETGVISRKLKRGKNTTRHSELIELCGGFLVDTPGFSSLNMSFVNKDELQGYFPEFQNVIENCKFNTCLHYKEPGCAVKSMVEEGKIDRERYNFYIKMLEDIIKNKRNTW